MSLMKKEKEAKLIYNRQKGCIIVLMQDNIRG